MTLLYTCFHIENGRGGGANGGLANDDSNTMPNMNEDDDDDDDLDAADDIEAQKKHCMEADPVSGVEDEPPPQNISRFDHKQKKGFVDVWWLFDDGGKLRKQLGIYAF